MTDKKYIFANDPVLKEGFFFLSGMDELSQS